MRKTYKIEIDCANCAAKVEDVIKHIDGVNECIINFMMQKMIIDINADKFDEVLKLAIKKGKKVERDFEVLD